MSERYERGLVEAAKSNRRAMDKQARGKGVEGKGAGGAGGDFVVLDGEGEEEINGEFRCYQDIEARLGEPTHYWASLDGFYLGVTLAQRLYTVIEKAIEYNNKHAERHRKRREESLGFSPRSIHASSMHDFNPASPALSLHQKIRNILNSPDGSIGPGARIRNSMYNFPPALADLLASEAKPSKPQPKVTLEIVTDAGMPGVVTESALKGQKPILLLGADKILPSGDVVNKTGSLTVASFAKSADARVLVIARGDKVQSANDGETFDPESNSGSELCAAWFASAGNTAASDKMKMFVTKAMEGEVLKISNSYFEKIPSDFVSSYVTELGPLDIDQIKKLGDDRAALEDKVWGKD
ncbi:hypothetical protein BT69DRAFT_1395694 [Atractiella rhizophila]|nr:hypothetical protein BT69DRAFT_1395694 [Atractiella rhizophila]